MRVAIISALIQLLTITSSIGESESQELGGGESGRGHESGSALHSSDSSQQQHTAYFNKDSLTADFHVVASNFQETPDAGESWGGGRGNTHTHDCNEKDITVCINLLAVLTNKDLGFAASVDELNRMCPVLLNGLQCIDNYTRRCLTQKHREYFNKLYAGTIHVIKDLCNTKGSYQQEYLHHAPCMRQVNPKYNQCSEIYHEKTAGLNHINDAKTNLSDDDKNKNVITLCCSFQEYLQCSERVVFETCGNETALFTKEFLDRMAGPIVQFKCVKYAPGSQVCENAGSSTVTLCSLVSLVLFLYSLTHLLA